MHIINNLNIRTKLGILFMILITVVSFLSLNTNFQTQNIEKHQKVHINLDLITNINNDIILPLYELLNYINSTNTLIKEKKKLRLYISSISESFLKHKKYDTFILWEKYIKHTDLNILYDHSKKDELDILIAKLTSENKLFLKETKNLYNDAFSESEDIMFITYIFLGLTLTFSILIGWMISNNILSSISKVQEGLSDFFNYLNYKDIKIKKIRLNNKDEFSQIAKEINTNVENIQNNIIKDRTLLKNATEILTNIQKGDLSTRITANTHNEPLNKLKVMINSMLDNLENQIQNEIKKRLEQEQLLIQQSKLASMGEMIGNIAHQWRQPLSQVSAILLNLQVRQEFDSCTKEYFNEKVLETNKLTDYMSKTINDFQNFFKPESEKKKFSIKQACNDAQLIIAASLKYHRIKLILEIEKDTNIYGYKNEYSQVILNIISNARDALIEKKIKNPSIIISIKNGQNYGLVKIQDNAGGIPKQIIKNIFDPYFTTKHKSKGTGIGLYMSKSIIENNMNGFIDVLNTKEGACFTIKVIK